MILLRPSDIPSIRCELLEQQRYQCAICSCAVGHSSPVDHDHDTGRVRGVLCRTCNTNEGKVKAACRYMARVTHLSRIDYVQWFINLVKYWTLHKDHPSDYVHPTFDVEKQKQKPKTRRKRK